MTISRGYKELCACTLTVSYWLCSRKHNKVPSILWSQIDLSWRGDFLPAVLMSEVWLSLRPWLIYWQFVSAFLVLTGLLFWDWLLDFLWPWPLLDYSMWSCILPSQYQFLDLLLIFAWVPPMTSFFRTREGVYRTCIAIKHPNSFL